MRILLYEFVHAGGWKALGWAPPAESMRREGAAMLAAVTTDFSVLDGVEIVIAHDGQEGATGGLSNSAELAGFDWILLIAPETDGVLYELCRRVESGGGRLLGPSSEFVQLTSDKHRTAEHLAAAGIPTPRGILLPAGAPLPHDFCYHAVLKPVDGAGSQDTWYVDGPSAACVNVALAHNQSPRRLERYCPGTPASVAVLCGPAGNFPLVPCRQRLSDDGRFRYLGGALPLAHDLSMRASELAMRALSALPPALGYVGVDLVLGDDPSGKGDVVIEINPRLTTSYVGLRALCEQNLAQAMLQAATGTVPNLSWRVRTVEFGADGHITLAD